MAVPAVAHSDENLGHYDTDLRVARLPGGPDQGAPQRDPQDLRPARGMLKGIALGVGAWAAILAAAAATLRLL